MDKLKCFAVISEA